MPARLRAQALKPLDDVVGPRAVRALPTHDDQTHAEVLALIDELLALGAQERVSVPASDPPNVTRLLVPSGK